MTGLRRLLSLLCIAVLAPLAAAQDPSTPPRGEGREAMWPAPTAEDWARPCLLTFQRSWEDAQALARETGKAILICINMDGEIASEHYAGVRYRQPEIAQLYEPYVCVIASVYRHAPRDYDDEGNRILCPRFGSVTCGEHIRIEPILFKLFLDDQRIAPRHIMVEQDGSETYDIFYANDTASVFKAIQDGIANRTAEPKTIVRGDRPILDRVGSRDIGDRTAVETAYDAGDIEDRKKLLQKAIEQIDTDPTDLLRKAVFGLDVELSKVARQALAETNSEGAIDLIAEALRVPMDTAERDKLIAALERIGDKSDKAWWLAVVQRGLATGSEAVDVQGWTKAFDSAKATGTGTYAAKADTGPDDGSAKRWMVLEALCASKRDACAARPDDPVPHVELAETALGLAFRADETFGDDVRTARGWKREMFANARRAAARAEELGSADWRVHGVQALAKYYDGDVPGSYPHAEKAVAALPPGEPGWNAMACLTIFAESRWKAIKAAVSAREKWPPQLLTDVDAAYAVLLQHPLGTADQVVWHYDLLWWLRAYGRASNVLDRALARFPNASVLHNRLRRSLLMRGGVEALEARYDELLAAPDPARDLAWFAGIASLTGAENHRRVGKNAEALASYQRAIERFERAARDNPATKASSNHYAAFAYAGRARVAYQLDDDDGALAAILSAFELSPDSAGSRDDMGITPGETGQMLLLRLREREKTEAAERLTAALQKLDPELLLPDRP